MAGEGDSRGATFKDEKSRLEDGLKSCQNVVENYRAMLKAEVEEDAPAEAKPAGKTAP